MLDISTTSANAGIAGNGTSGNAFDWNGLLKEVIKVGVPLITKPKASSVPTVGTPPIVLNAETTETQQSGNMLMILIVGLLAWKVLS